jgi:hypothetical protein
LRVRVEEEAALRRNQDDHAMNMCHGNKAGTEDLSGKTDCGRGGIG